MDAMANNILTHKHAISWTDRTWNPMKGCSRMSSGCVNCYAEKFAARQAGPGKYYETLVRRGADGKVKGWSGEVQLFESVLYEDITVDQKPSLVFVNSMSDMWHERLSYSDIDLVVEHIRNCKQHVFQVLTKRSDNLATYWSTRSVPTNLWIGVSIEDRASLSRLDGLEAVQTPNKWVSAEPLLEDLGRVDWSSAGVKWLVLGGESGPGARLCEDEWIRKQVLGRTRQGVACHVKQMGSAWVRRQRAGTGKGADPTFWPEDLRVREDPDWFGTAPAPTVTKPVAIPQDMVRVDVTLAGKSYRGYVVPA